MLPRRCCWFPRLFLGLALLIISSIAASAETVVPDEKAIEDAAISLGSPKFEEREAATRFLWKHADSAAALLKEAQSSDDAEVRVRADRIQEAYQLGILPDTPLDVARRIYEFHDGDLRQKRQILNELISSEDLTTVQRLLRSVENDVVRDQLAEGLANAFRVKLLDQLLVDDLDGASKLLERGALSQVGMRDYAVFAHLTNQTDAALAKTTNNAHGRQVKLWLLRAAGRMDEALEIVKDDPDQTNIIKSADGDAIAFCEHALKDHEASPALKARHRAFKARFSKDKAAYDEAINDLLNIAKLADDFHQGEAIDALFLNGVVDPVLPHLPKIPGKGAYDIQTYRANYGSALKAIGIDVKKAPFTKWVEERCAKLRKDTQDPCFIELLELAANVHDMGGKEEALRITEATHKALEGMPKRQEEVLQEEIRLGLRDRAEARVRKLAESVPLDTLRDKFVPNSTIVEQWFNYFVDHEEGNEAKPRLETLFRAWRLVNVQEDEAPMPTKEIDALLDAGFEKSQALPKTMRINYLWNLLVTADKHDRKDKALLYIETLDKVNSEGSSIGNLAEFQEQQKQWGKAAKTYERLWQSNLLAAKADLTKNTNTNTLQPVYLYRAGKAYEKAGESDKAAKMIHQARLLCLGDLYARFAMAGSMSTLGDDSLAQDEWRLIARLSQPEDSVGMQAFNNLANDLKKTDLKGAIRYLERAMVSRFILGQFRNPVFIYTYDLNMQSRWLQWTALLHLKEGDADSAVTTIQRFWEHTPGNASIGEELLPRLEAAGKTKEALDFYEKTRALTLEACDIFPKSAMAHNNLAWLDARSRRHLDDAMEHATLACELKPKQAAYLDTLAEVHFALGDRAKALELSDEAIKYLPDDDELLGQRERFENAPLPEKR